MQWGDKFHNEAAYYPYYEWGCGEHLEADSESDYIIHYSIRQSCETGEFSIVFEVDDCQFHHQLVGYDVSLEYAKKCASTWVFTLLHGRWMLSLLRK